MQGMDIAAVESIRAVTGRKLSAAGGITTQAEVDDLEAHGIDAVVGMAIYTGALQIGALGAP